MESTDKKPRKKRVTKAEFKRYQKAIQEERENNPILKALQERRKRAESQES